MASTSIIFSDLERPTRNKGPSLVRVVRDFAVIDLETTGLDPRFCEIIEVAAVRVRDFCVTEVFHELIKPEEPIPPFISALTGITNEMVENARSIDAVLPELIHFLDGDIILGHNVNFDLNFICDASALLGAPYTGTGYLDTLRLSRIVLKDLGSHGLSALRDHFEIEPFREHRALSDCYDTLEVYGHLLNIMREASGTAEAYLESWHEDRKKRRALQSSFRVSLVQAATDEFDPEHPAYKQAFVFTGALERMVRKDAAQLVVNAGGICHDSVKKDTDFLVLGDKDFADSAAGKKTSKLLRAEELIMKGSSLQIISETVFLVMFIDAANLE